MVDAAKQPLTKDSLVPGALIREQDQLRQLLISSKRNDQIKNLYDHIVEVMDFLVVHYPQDAILKFEEVSYLIKTGDEAKLKQFLKTQESKRYAAHSDSTTKATSAYLERASALCTSAAPQTSNDEEEPVAAGTPVCYIPDVISDNKTVYQWAGINLGDFNCMMLQKSLQKLAQTSGATKLRLWGKIHGTEKDYFVAEGSAEAPATEEEQPADKEPRGTGVNEFAYWVCNSPDEGKWTALPDLLPSDIDIARQVKFHFTGDLERRIITNPFFHKRESFLLRAQIARISISTAVVPKGMFRTQEETPTEIEENLPDEGPVPVPSVTEMGKANMWVHHMKSILKCNRTTLMEAEAPEDVDPEEFAKKRALADPSEKRLKSICEDQKVKGGAPAWTVRSYGDSTTYQAANPTAAKQNFGVVVVRSNTWPGSISFFTQQRQHMSVYVGDGLKFESNTYYPVHTPKMQADPVEKLTYAEPNPTEAAIKRKAEQEARDASGAQDE